MLARDRLASSEESTILIGRVVGHSSGWPWSVGVELAEFLRLFPMRAPNIMWFLGAGASAAARIPTAWHMLWDFKRALFCSELRRSPKTLGDWGDEALRHRLQSHFDSKGTFPPEGADDEYSRYFEAAYPHEMDRRKYIEQQTAGGTPSFGHRMLALLVKHEKIRLVWTTNFDRMIEDSASSTLGGTGRLVTATLDSALLASEAYAENRFPLLVKLHGDFQSRRLKNVSRELATQDADFRRTLVDACGRFGLVVVGYSGRDQSIMQALEEGIKDGRGFPSGLFWFHRSDSPPTTQVRRLLDLASAKGTQAATVEIETFDELMGDLTRQFTDISDDLISALSVKESRVSNAPIPARGKGWPVVRLNAFPLLEHPQTCRRVVCDIGGSREVREAVMDAGVSVLAARRRGGVLAFGSDIDVRSAFARYGISAFDLHAFEARRFYYESADLGLLYDALCNGIARTRPVLLDRTGRRCRLRVDPARQNEAAYATLKTSAKGGICGAVSSAGFEWAEATEVRLDYRFDRLWLLLTPTLWTSEATSEDGKAQAAEFKRERKAKRYNNIGAQFLEAWRDLVLGNPSSASAVEVRALGIADGVDAVFSVGLTTAFTRRAR